MKIFYTSAIERQLGQFGRSGGIPLHIWGFIDEIVKGTGEDFALSGEWQDFHAHHADGDWYVLYTKVDDELRIAAMVEIDREKLQDV
jgi:hypothetical protein